MTQTNGRNVMVQGRIVWTSGDLFKGKPKLDPNTKQQKVNARGEPMIEYGFGLAVPKSVLQQVGPGQPGEIWAAIHEEAYTLYPNRQLPPGFAMKYKDGDGVDHLGQPMNTRAGHAGHLIFACTTTIPIKYYRYENGQNILINDGIKCGDFVNVQVNIKAHPPMGQGKAGLYINPNAVQFMGYGEAIINAPSADSIFGNVAPQVPQGASATPIAPAGFIVPTGAPMGNVPPVQAAVPQPGFMPAPQPVTGAYPSNVAPAPAPAHYGVLPQTHQPPQMPAAPTMPAYPQMPR